MGLTTPRDVVAQTLDYASCVKNLSAAQIADIFTAYQNRKSPSAAQAAVKTLAEAFSLRFGYSLPEAINNSHSMVIVASSLDDSSERIVSYLQEEFGININAVFFNIFQTGINEIIARSWLTDPEQTAAIASEKSNLQTVASRFWYLNIGEDHFRDWDDCRRYGFLSAGYGAKYSDALSKLNHGDQVFAYLKGKGYVGFGRVIVPAVMVRDFFVEQENKMLLELPLAQPGLSHDKDDPELADYAVKIEWHETFDKDQARWFPGAFANQNIVCKLREGATADFLRNEFQTFRFA